MAKTEKAKVQRIAPPAKPELLPHKEGCVKIRLTYLTPEPHHVRNSMLRVQGIKPPYLEEVHILMPQKRVFALIETFMPAFESLQDVGVLSKDATLQSFKLAEEDIQTLAYCF